MRLMERGFWQQLFWLDERPYKWGIASFSTTLEEDLWIAKDIRKRIGRVAWTGYGRSG